MIDRYKSNFLNVVRVQNLTSYPEKMRAVGKKKSFHLKRYFCCHNGHSSIGIKWWDTGEV